LCFSASWDITVKIVVPTRGSLLAAMRAAAVTGTGRSFTLGFREKTGACECGELYFRGLRPHDNNDRLMR
jgi:hypothetical protein